MILELYIIFKFWLLILSLLFFIYFLLYAELSRKAACGDADRPLRNKFII